MENEWDQWSKKEYFFSYDGIKQRLRKFRRMGIFDDIEKVSPLDILVVMLHNEEIGDLSEVEWRPFKITIEKLEKMAVFIEKPDEINRVFSYLSDHAAEVLPYDADIEEIDKFELECDRIVSKLWREKKTNLSQEQKFQINNVLISYANIREDLKSGELEGKDGIIFKHMWKQPNYSQTNLFSYQVLFYAALLATCNARLLGENIDEPTVENRIDGIIKDIKATIALLSGKPVRDHREPLIQALYMVSVFTRFISIDKKFVNFSDDLIKYVEKIYVVDISDSVKDAVIELREYAMNKISQSVREELERQEKLGEIERINGEESEIDSEPSKSFFRTENLSSDICEKELLKIIEESRGKSCACRKIQDDAHTIYFKLADKTDQEKADLINPWVAKTSKKSSEKWIFTADDFCKARNKQLKK